jgi:hypothetical protein
MMTARCRQYMMGARCRLVELTMVCIAQLSNEKGNGHSALDPPNARALVAATDKFAG